MNKKNIVILTAVHPNKASGKVVMDVKKLLSEKGHDVLIVTNTYLSEKLQDVISVKTILDVLKFRVRKYLRILSKGRERTDPNYYMFDHRSHLKNFNVNKVLSKIPFKVDAFIYMFPHFFLNEKEIYKLNKKTGAPIYRYLADMAEFTGGCHYAWDCEGYTRNCGKCPGLFSEDPQDFTYKNLTFKKVYIDKTEVYPIAASEWQMQQLSKSMLYKDKKRFKILLPVDENIFFPQDKTDARKALGLPLDKKIIFFGAVNTIEKRKGAKELLTALKSLNQSMLLEKSDDIHLAIAGKADSTFIDQLYFTSTILGYLNYENLAKAYNASDVFVCSSIEDSGPSMINQSMMCGTPVVSFEMGVSIDLVRNNETGFRVELRNNVELSNAIEKVLLLSQKELNTMRLNCQKIAVELCSYDSFYKNLFKVIK
jgi:glycosyltransferase involved in cell wall biosynthesis